jgi:hypothetical protein
MYVKVSLTKKQEKQGLILIKACEGRREGEAITISYLK